MALFCTPVYVVGLGRLLLFHPDFGRWPLPPFFSAAPVPLSPFSAPWEWLRTLLVPWLVAAAPLAAMCLRLVLGLVREELEADYIRTAYAKGLPHDRVIRRHAGPFRPGGHRVADRRERAAGRDEPAPRGPRLLGARLLPAHVARERPRPQGL